MRKLHPIGPHEVLLRQGCIRRPDGAEEVWTLHGLPEERALLRVEVEGAELWHLTVDGEGRPERLELRLAEAGRQLEATFTFFEDEVLVWRRGSEPSSQAIDLPPGYRLLWPPVAGRDVCLAGVAPEDGRAEALMCLSVLRKPAARGFLSARPVKYTVTATPGTLTLATPGRPTMRGELDEEGGLARWTEGEEVWEEIGPPDAA